MRQDKTKITVKFNKIDNNVLGYLPNDINYPNEPFIDSDEIGYIEITKEAWENRPEQAIINGNSIEEYRRPDSELLAQAKIAKIAQVLINRNNWMYQPVEYLETTFFSTLIAGNNLTAAARSPRNIGIGSVQWISAEGILILLTINQMEDIINLIEDQRGYSYFQEATLTAQIKAIEIIENEDPEIAVTYEQAIEALNNIDITF